FGTVNVVDGSYEAFGTRLAIESGLINFQGSLSDPNLNIVAMRRQQDVAAGVRVTGNARQPRVQLVSEPDMPRDEQLSWLVFGRSGAGGETGQAQAAVQGAALGLLNKLGAGRTARSVGLDTIAIGESKFGLSGAQVVNLGKEISDRLYIGYEQSLAGAESVLKLIYTLTPNWSVALRGGAVTGVDALYSKRFDKLR
ncbi:MAG: translocation/assembly module TamB domain-containing protein, partial [Rhodoferax sp.]